MIFRQADFTNEMIYAAVNLCKVEREGTTKYFFEDPPHPQDKKEDRNSEYDDKEEEVMVGGRGDRSEGGVRCRW